MCERERSVCLRSSLLQVFGPRPRESPRNVRVKSGSLLFRPLRRDGPRTHSPPALHCRGPRCHGDPVAQFRPSPLDPFLTKRCPCSPACAQTHRRLTCAACFFVRRPWSCWLLRTHLHARPTSSCSPVKPLRHPLTFQFLAATL